MALARAGTLTPWARGAYPRGMRVLLLLPLVLAAAACQTPNSLDREPMPLTGAERGLVVAQVKAARNPVVADWTGAWNQAVDAGLGRDVLEGIALDALEEDAGVSESMIQALRDKFGGLSEAARQRVDRLSATAASKGDHERALEIQIEAAEDPKTLEGAWRVYHAAPPDEAAGLLETLRKAREKATDR